VRELQALGADRRGRIGKGQANDAELAAAGIIGVSSTEGNGFWSALASATSWSLPSTIAYSARRFSLLPAMTMSSVLASSETTSP